jgi:phosphatidylglycerol:prolipoprotein diacylglycerol transferase
MALQHPNIDPVAIHLGSWNIFGHVRTFDIHWYGLTYMVAFGLFVWLAGRRAQYPWFARDGWLRRDVEDLLFYGVLGVVLGGRLGYVLFYKPLYYLHNPGEIPAVWNGGMSFHGGMLGVIVAMALFAWQRKRPFLQVTDLIAPCVPLGLASGRVGNFINGELWGRIADPSLPWAMIFPESGTQEPRHPSQIYQFLGEGIALFIILWVFGKKERGRGQVSGLFLIGYGFFRFVAEYFRAPDDFIGDKSTLVGDPTTHLLTFGWSEGQWLCVPMVIAGLLLFWWASKQPRGGAQAA